MIHVAGKQIIWREGMTVSDLLQELEDPHPYAVVRINRQYVTQPRFADTLVPDESEVFLIPMIAGG